VSGAAGDGRCVGIGIAPARLVCSCFFHLHSLFLAFSRTRWMVRSYPRLGRGPGLRRYSESEREMMSGEEENSCEGAALLHYRNKGEE
jgi:hypothetical protein